MSLSLNSGVHYFRTVQPGPLPPGGLTPVYYSTCNTYFSLIYVLFYNYDKQCIYEKFMYRILRQGHIPYFSALLWAMLHTFTIVCFSYFHNCKRNSL